MHSYHNRTNLDLPVLIGEVVSESYIKEACSKAVMAAISQLRLLRHYDLRVDTVKALVLSSHSSNSGVVVFTVKWENLQFKHKYKMHFDLQAANAAVEEACRFQCNVLHRLLYDRTMGMHMASAGHGQYSVCKPNKIQLDSVFRPLVALNAFVMPLSNDDLALFGAGATQIESQASLLVRGRSMTEPSQEVYYKLPLSDRDRSGIRDASDIVIDKCAIFGAHRRASW